MKLTNLVDLKQRNWSTLSPESAVLPSHGRENNLSLLLQTLHLRGPQSRADLSRATGLTRVTVSELITELLDRSHVVELGHQDIKRPGKPATLVDLNRGGLQIIGVDLSGTEPLRAALLNLDGTVLRIFTATEPALLGQDAVAQVLKLIAQARAVATCPLLGIGIGTPGIVTAEGLVRRAEKFDWLDLDLQALVQRETGLPTSVLNDADCAVLAEHTFGEGSEHMMLIRLGRGIGCATIIHNGLVRGSSFAAGELGHVKLTPDTGTKCTCGERGCLETYASIPAITAALAQQNATPGSAKYAQIIRSATAHLASAVAPVLSVLDIHNVVLTGPKDTVNEQFKDEFRLALAGRSATVNSPSFSLQLSEIPADIVLQGSAVNVLYNELGIA